MNGLPDILEPELGVVFCGTAAGRASAARGHYYAGPGNKFWPTLARTGITPRLLRPSDDVEALRYGIGFTDLVKDLAGMDRDLPAASLGAAARKRLWDVIGACRPARIAFNGKKSASVALDCKRPVCGLQEARHPLGPEVWILPSSSGAASGFWDLEPWQALADALRQDVPAAR